MPQQHTLKIRISGPETSHSIQRSHSHSGPPRPRRRQPYDQYIRACHRFLIPLANDFTIAPATAGIYCSQWVAYWASFVPSIDRNFSHALSNKVPVAGAWQPNAETEDDLLGLFGLHGGPHPGGPYLAGHTFVQRVEPVLGRGPSATVYSTVRGRLRVRYQSIAKLSDPRETLRKVDLGSSDSG
jgi:hypothetical protein